MHSALVVLFTYLIWAFTSAEEGSSCKIVTSGKEGICISIENCTYAQNLLRNRIYPQTCGFVGKIPLVCCIFTSGTEPLTLSNQTTSSESNLPIISTAKESELVEAPKLQNNGSALNQNFGELSRNKCLAYYPKPRYPIFITGGKPSLAKEFPHMAIIGYGTKENIQWQCAGSLISKKFILTAAHCLDSKIGEAKYVRLGDLDLSNDEDDASPENFTIVKAIPHPMFKPPIRYHDIALLQLDREVALSAYVSPACLYTEKDLTESNITATGWGRTKFGGNSSSIMMKVDLDHIPNKKCVKDFGLVSNTLLPKSIVEDFQICAGGTLGQDTCQGDSGGPLQIPNIERTFTVKVHHIIGVTSFGKACGLSKAPGIYSRVYNYIPWIESIAWENETDFGKPRPLN